MANATAGGIRSPVFKMQFDAYSDDDKLKNPINREALPGAPTTSSSPG
jgi:hypothetical protein